MCNKLLKKDMNFLFLKFRLLDMQSKKENILGLLGGSVG